MSRLVFAFSLLYKHLSYNASEQVRPTMHRVRLPSQKHNPPQVTQLRQASPRAAMLARAIREGLTPSFTVAPFRVPTTYQVVQYTGACKEEIKPGLGEVIHV